MSRYVPLVLILACACTKTKPVETTTTTNDAGVVVTASVAVIRGPTWNLDVTRFDPPDVPDALTFHGWSADGRRYAFEYYVAAVAADCEDRFLLYIVDAETDRFVKGGAFELVRDRLEGDAEGRCEPPDLRQLMDRRRPELLQRHGIVAGNLRAPHQLKQSQDSWSVSWTDGTTSNIGFSVKHRTDDPYGAEAQAGASYVLTIDGRTIEPGTRRRPGVIRYGLEEALVFESPNGRHAALVLQRFERGFEGARPSWMSNGLVR